MQSPLVSVKSQISGQLRNGGPPGSNGRPIDRSFGELSVAWHRAANVLHWLALAGAIARR
jgi:hypothetical protein